MPRKNVLQNKEYLELLRLIAKGINAPSQILINMNKQKVRESKAEETLSNLSMKFQQLKKYELVKVDRLRSMNHSSTSRHTLNYGGFVQTAINTFIPNLIKQEPNFIHTKYMDYLVEKMKVYIDAILKESTKTINYTIYGVLEDFILGAGLSQTKNNKSASWDDWSNRMAFMIECNNYVKSKVQNNPYFFPVDLL